MAHYIWGGSSLDYFLNNLLITGQSVSFTAFLPSVQRRQNWWFWNVGTSCFPKKISKYRHHCLVQNLPLLQLCFPQQCKKLSDLLYKSSLHDLILIISPGENEAQGVCFLSEVTKQTNSSLGCNASLRIVKCEHLPAAQHTDGGEQGRSSTLGLLGQVSRGDPVYVCPCVCQEIPDYRSLHKTEIFPLYVDTINIVY